MNSCPCKTGKPDYMPRETIYPILAVREICFFQWAGRSLEAILQGNSQEAVCPVQEPPQTSEEPTI